jgi:hypothetical protein
MRVCEGVSVSVCGGLMWRNVDHEEVPQHHSALFDVRSSVCCSVVKRSTGKHVRCNIVRYSTHSAVLL